MNKLSVSELAKLYGYSRQAIYAHINKGNLSKGADGLIDFAEALRVFGEPQKKEDLVNPRKSINSQNFTEIDILKRQVDMLEKQLNQSLLRENQSLERENFYQDQIEAMQRLLEAPKASSLNTPTFTDPNLKSSSSEGGAGNSNLDKQQPIAVPIENKRIPVPEHVEPEAKKRGFLSRFFLPNG